MYHRGSPRGFRTGTLEGRKSPGATNYNQVFLKDGRVHNSNQSLEFFCTHQVRHVTVFRIQAATSIIMTKDPVILAISPG